MAARVTGRAASRDRRALPQPSRVDVHRSATTYRGFVSVDEALLRYERFDGTMSQPVWRLSVQAPLSTAVVLLDRDRREVILVEQFRYSAWTAGRGWVVELIAGTVEDAERAEQAARREVLEETGYAAGGLQLIASFFVTPRMSSARVALYYAEVGDADRRGPGGGRRVEGEDIRLRRLGVDQLAAALRRGEIEDAKTLVGLLWLQDRLTAEAPD